MIRIGRWLLIGLVAAAGLWLAHAPVLRGLAGFLVADEPAGDFQYVCIPEWYHGPDGDRCYDAAAGLYREKSSRGILLVQSHADRLVESGVLPPFETLSRRQLEARGVPRQAISATHSDGRDDWAAARTLCAWLADRPNASLVVLCGAFRSAQVRYVLDSVLDPAQAARVRLRPLPNRRYDQTNWWTSREGVKAFGLEWLRRLHGWCAGGDHRPPPFHRADEYERDVRKRCIHQAEYLMLLNGDENTRPFAAAAMLKAGLARRALVAEMAVSPLVENHILPPCHEIGRAVLLKRGVREGDITILPAAVATTHDEAETLAAFLRDRPQTRVLVVTSDYHVRRSRWAFARVLAERAEQVSFVSAPSDQFPTDGWWQDEAAFLAIVTEPFKFAFYVVCYGHVGCWLAACGVLALVAAWIRRREAASQPSAPATPRQPGHNAAGQQ